MAKKGKGGKDALAEILGAVRGAFGKDAAFTLDGNEDRTSIVDEVIPFGIDVLDNYVLGCGGLPVGRMVEVYSEEGGGKSSLVAQALASCQQEGGVAIYCETENALNVERLSTFGVDTTRVIILQPSHLEEAIELMLATLHAAPVNGGPYLLAWDSIAATPTKQEVEEGTASFDTRAKTLSGFCRSIGKLANEKRCCLLFVNQVREKIGVMFGDKYTTPGGKAVKFTSSIRLQLLGGKGVKQKELHVGKDILVLATKNRMGSPYRKARVRLMYEAGWDSAWSTLEFAKECKLVEREARGEAAAAAVKVKLDALNWNKLAILKGATAPGTEEAPPEGWNPDDDEGAVPNEDGDGQG